MGLSTISEQFKKTVIWLGISLVALSLIWITWLLLSFVWGTIFPPPPLGPDSHFGKISKAFEPNFRVGSTIFELDTPGGKLPQSPNILPVFVIPNLTGKFVSLDTGKKIAHGGGMDSEPTKLSEFEWSWTAKKNRNKSLRLNIVTNNFNYSYDWAADPQSLVGVFKTTEDKIKTSARSFISNFKSMKADLKKSPTRLTYLRINGKDRTKVGSFSEANAILVELFREGIVYNTINYPMVEQDANLASINLLISPASSQKSLLDLNYTYYPYDSKQVGTYSIKTATEAYQDLKLGNAFIPNNTQGFETVTITKVSLGYLNPNSIEARYLQPVYIFEGEGQVNDIKKNFLAYTLAVTNDYIK